MNDTAASEATVSETQDPRGPEGLREVEREAERLAGDAAGFRDENERGRQRGPDTDYAFRLPPDMAEADRVRAGDDVELAGRQEQVAEIQRRAAEALRRNAELLQGTARELDRAGEAVRDNRGDLSAIQENAQEIQEQMAQAREQVGNTRVDPDGTGQSAGDGSSRNRSEGHEGGNG